MAETLSMHEVLEIARTMESNGVDFYTRAAGLYSNPEDGEFFRRLAGMEADHERTFARIQKALPPRPEERASAEAMFEASGLFLQALIDSENLEGSGFSRYVFTGKETPSQVVLMGVELEKETILYYMGLRDMFSESDDRKLIDEIIGEEKDHLSVLIKEFQKLQSKGK